MLPTSSASRTDLLAAPGGPFQLIVRPVQRGDRALLVQGFAELGEDSRYRRFFTPKADLSAEDLKGLTESDGEHALVLGLVARDAEGRERPVGVARYVRLQDEPDVAEAAVTIVDAMQRKGLGKLLLRALSTAAYEHGVRRFRGQVLSDNFGAQKLLRSLDPNLHLIARDPGSEQYEVVLPRP